MAFEGLYLILGFIVLAILVFIFIKKIISTIFIMAGLVILTLGCMFGIIYLDYSNISSYDKLEINIVYENLDKYYSGVILNVENKSVDFKELNFVKKENLNLLKEGSKAENQYLIILSRTFLENTLDSNKTYIVPKIGNFTKENLLDIIENKYEGNEIINQLNEMSNSTDIMKSEDLIFGLVLKEIILSPTGILEIIDGYKEDEIEIDPDRMSLKILSLIPTGLIKDIVATE